jgi:hypothetical protein
MPTISRNTSCIALRLGMYPMSIRFHEFCFFYFQDFGFRGFFFLGLGFFFCIVFMGVTSLMVMKDMTPLWLFLMPFYVDGTIYMFDCGEGVQRQLHRTPFRQKSIDSIFITHMHGDHVSLL